MSRTGLSWPVPALIGILLSLVGVTVIALAGSSLPMTALGLGIVLLGIVVTARSFQGRSSSAPGSHDRPPGTPVHQPGGPQLAGRPSPSPSHPGDVQADPLPKAGGDYLTPILGELTASFLRWFQDRNVSHGLWPAYDRWLRDTLDQFLRARRIRCFRVAEADERLVSLAGDMENAFWLGSSLPALIQHVLATGRRYVQGAPGNGELIERLAAQWSSEAAPGETNNILASAPVWLLPLKEKNKTTGLLAVGELSEETLRDPTTLQAVGHLLELYWRHVCQADTLETALRSDHASGVLSRADLSSMADKVLYDSINDGEPIVVLAMSVEGLRRLDDEGQWADRDWLIRQIGLAMRQKLRSDDLVGRFSDDRFVAVLRRLDISLGNLIAGKLLAAVRGAVHEQPALAERVQLRCALAEVRGESLETVLARIFDALQRARQEKKDIVAVASRDAAPGRALTEVTS